MSKNGFLALLVCAASGIGLAACSGGGGGTPPPSGPTEPSAPTLSEASAAVESYERRLEAATTDAEREDLRLRLGAARADEARARASEDLGKARAKLAEAAGAPTADLIDEAERLLAAARASAVSALEAAVAAVKAAGGDAASTADAEALLARVRPAAASALEEAVAVQARARELLEDVVGYQASAGAQISRLRQQVSGGGSGSDGAYSAERAAVRRAVEASRQAASANTPEALAAARAAIASARSALDALVSAADAAVEAAAVGSAARGAATQAQAAARAFRTEQALLLDAAEGSMAWSSRLPVAFVALSRPPEVAAVHALRRTVNGTREHADNSIYVPDLLTPSDIPALMYEAGKIVMAPGRAGSGDRLRMRGMPITYSAHAYGTQAMNLQYASALLEGTTYTGQYVARNLGDIQNNRPALIGGLRITRDGLAVDLGGKGAPGWDFRVENFGFSFGDYLSPFDPTSTTSPNHRWTRNGYDLALTFGRPSASPQGSAEHRWLAELMPTAAQVAAADTGWLKDGGRTLALGIYDLRLSNHIGRNANAEDPNGPPYPDDDENFYLSYAAYGFMDFYRPNQSKTHNLGGRNGLHRIFPFQVGYDAFRDDPGSRTTDIAEAITGGTFKGRTLAQEFSIVTSGSTGDPVYLSPTDTKRMRGDIELTATISGTSASNTIAGKISNMEDWVVQDGIWMWRDSTSIPADIRFHTDGTIDAKGEFTGTFANYPTGFERGGYRGNFYGPRGSLEAAGTWVMQAAGSRDRAIAGSFGAALVREDGSYGTRVVGGGS